jgi:hypothetical protein
MLDPSIDRVLRRVAVRLRCQAAIDGAAFLSLLAAACVLVAAYLLRLHVLSGGDFAYAALVAVALVAAGGVVGALRLVSLQRAAKAIDRSHGLKDRMGSAVSFSSVEAASHEDDETAAFRAAAIRDAARAVSTVDPRRAAPLARPAGLGHAAAVAAMAGAVLLLRFPSRGPEAAGSSSHLSPHFTVDREVLEPEREAIAALSEEALREGDHELKALADELERLLAAIDREELSRKEVFDKLAELERKLPKAEPGAVEPLKEALKKAGDELSKDKLLREAGKALKDEDLDKAAADLKKLAEEAERLEAERRARDPKLDDKQRDAAARSLERAAEELSAEEKEAQKRVEEERRLREEQRRLEREAQEHPNDQDVQRRLQRNQRQLERLEREQKQAAERRRQLERLSRELEKAAEQLRSKMSPEALKRAAEELSRMQDEIRKLGSQGQVRLQIAEIKEVMRRMGRSSQGGSGGGAGGGRDQQGQPGGARSQNAPGGRGKDGRGNGRQAHADNGRGSMLREFDQRAGGDKPSALLLGGDKGDQALVLPLPGGAKKPPEPGSGGPGTSNDSGIGSNHDPNLFGDPTKLAAKRHETRVEGKEGAGPSRSETILGSAEHGFATGAYRRTFSDYSAVVEEVMQREQIPPGYRFYVKRYFQLIKPRE